MKRLLALLFAVVSVVALQAQTQDNAMYVYRNDGAVTPMFREDIDSITLSYYDADSILCDEPVCQVFHTADTVYRIPIEVIDSVSFYTPETIYQPNVRIIEGELRNSILSRNGLNLLVSSNIPHNVIPKVGEKLVSTTSDEFLKSAFVGRVKEINSMSEGMEIICEPVDLTDVFERYYGIIKKESETTEYQQAKVKRISDGFYGTGSRHLNPGRLPLFLRDNFDFTISYEKNDNLAFQIDRLVSEIWITPSVKYNAFIVVNKDYGVNVSVTATGNYSTEEFFALTGGLEIGKEFKIFEKAIPIPEALVDITFEFGAFVKATGTISFEQEWEQKYKHVFHWEWSSKRQESLKKTNDIKRISNEHHGNAALSGSFAAGLYGKVGVAFIATSQLDIAEINLKLEGGMSLEGTYVPYKKDIEQAKTSTDIYNQIKDSDLSLNWYYGLSAEAKLFNWSISHDIPNFWNIPFNKKEPIASIRAVPLFSDTKINILPDGRLSASTKATGKVAKTDIGLAIINEEDKTDAIYEYVIRDYDGPSENVVVDFSNNLTASKYIVYPLVKYMGMELIAEPQAEIVGNSVDITDFHIISSQHNKDGGFFYNGSTYRYKFNISASLELKNEEGVEDWGYVIEDPQGGREFVSLIEFGTSFTDTRNACYRNCSESTVTIFGYVKYPGENQYVYYDPQTFPLVHIENSEEVDLGLSVNWRAWNVGAEAPDEPGAFFAWAETSPKQDYSWGNYSDSPYYEDGGWRGCSIMLDISSTEHDAATVALGEKWRMPTKDEMQELLDNCEWVWEENGYRVTGPNGNSIFLPAAGNADGGNVNQAGSYGGYWTSTPNESESKATASNLYFYKASTKSIQWSNRYVGRSIRPVTSRD